MVSEPERTTLISASSRPPASATAVIVAGNEETRVLLRGLVRLQHVHVVGEAEGSTEGLQLVQLHRPTLVLIEASLLEGSAATLIQAAHSLLPASRLVVVGTVDPQGGPTPRADSIAYLRKPFRIAEFVQAIGRNPPSS
jgi:response regulator RpfG family c-di-GMP phosphodiesterase